MWGFHVDDAEVMGGTSGLSGMGGVLVAPGQHPAVPGGRRWIFVRRIGGPARVSPGTLGGLVARVSDHAVRSAEGCWHPGPVRRRRVGGCPCDLEWAQAGSMANEPGGLGHVRAEFSGDEPAR